MKARTPQESGRMHLRAARCACRSACRGRTAGPLHATCPSTDPLVPLHVAPLHAACSACRAACSALIKVILMPQG